MFKRNMSIECYGANGKVVKVKTGYDVVIRVPFCNKGTAERALDQIKKESV